ncbi:hypothetical protein L1987_21390 [Smallanthus sonchifolius]|uniref:Uncharacterized protein n=1 Tax=Smallanthus sonchifolius TaxID=185202 RepID=A0ACB9IVG1_9ASTR|nr:hypothetical protein L1987_21390 [Smallanthus sonchifolius]
MANGGRVYTEADYPYEADQGECRCAQYQPATTIDGFKMVEPVRDDNVMKEVIKKHPVTAVMNSIDIRAYLKDSGILFYQPGPANNKLDHVVLITGGVDYWNCRNCWGPYWGVKGNFRLQRNVDTPMNVGTYGIARRCFYPMKKGFNYPEKGGGQQVGSSNQVKKHQRRRCILLVLESSRVDIAVLLNDLAYLKYDKSKEALDAETVNVKQRNLGIAFSLVEKIIKLISSIAEDEGNIISEKMFTKITSGLNETIGVILEYLRDAKDHGQHKGNDFLASVRIGGSFFVFFSGYLAETPAACHDKVVDLLGYMVSVQGEDEPSPFSAVCFLLPMLCQITMEVDGCQLIGSSGAYKALLSGYNEDNGSIFLACDKILNLLLKKEQIQVRLLSAMSSWAEDAVEWSCIMMASSICTLILDSTSETLLQSNPHLNRNNFSSLCQLMKRSLATFGKVSYLNPSSIMNTIICPYASSLADMPFAPYPVGSYISTLAPSSSSSELRPELTSTTTDRHSTTMLPSQVVPLDQVSQIVCRFLNQLVVLRLLKTIPSKPNPIF